MAATSAMVSWKDKAERMKRSIEKHKVEAKLATTRTVNALVTVTGGAVAGALDAKIPVIPGTTAPTVAVGGGLILAAGVFGLLDEQSDVVSALGAGMLAVVVAKETEKAMKGLDIQIGPAAAA